MCIHWIYSQYGSERQWNARLRIRVEWSSRERFVEACNSEDGPTASAFTGQAAKNQKGGKRGEGEE